MGRKSAASVAAQTGGKASAKKKADASISKIK